MSWQRETELECRKAGKQDEGKEIDPSRTLEMRQGGVQAEQVKVPLGAILRRDGMLIG
jgi:hypothetical protein